MVYRASLEAQLVKNPPAMWGTWVRFLIWEDPLEKGKATHSSALAWRSHSPWGRKESDTLSAFHCIITIRCININVLCVLSRLSHVQLCNTRDCSPPGSCVRGIFHARILELPFPPPENLPNPGTEPTSLVSSALAGIFFTTGTT